MHYYTITVSDSKAVPDPLQVNVGDAVTWTLAEGSSDLQIYWDNEIFEKKQCVLYSNGNMGLVAKNPGTHAYHVLADNGTPQYDPTIIIDPVVDTAEHAKK